MARNAVERIFGCVKKKFRLLSAGASYSVSSQAKMVLAICALHNFIRVHDEVDEENIYGVDIEEGGRFQYPDADQLRNYLGSGTVTREEQERASACRDDIANRMWVDYQLYLNEQLLHDN